MQAAPDPRGDRLPVQAAEPVGGCAPPGLQLPGPGEPLAAHRDLPRLPRDEGEPQCARVARGDQRWVWLGLLQVILMLCGWGPGYCKLF